MQKNNIMKGNEKGKLSEFLFSLKVVKGGSWAQSLGNRIPLAQPVNIACSVVIRQICHCEHIIRKNMNYTSKQYHSILFSMNVLNTKIV